MLKQFKEFAFKGNLIDMAVGFILGGAFATVVKSLVDNIIMPPLGLILGGIDFTQMKYVLQEGESTTAADGTVTETVAEVAIGYGQTISDLIAFIMLAFVVFIIIKKVIEGKKEEEEEVEETPAQEVLLGEIRDLLKK